MEEQSRSVLNGNYKGDEEGEWTKEGTQVIDYVIGNDSTRERIREFRVEDKIDSDHKPITVWIKGERRNFEEYNRGRREKKGDWSEEETGEGEEQFLERSLEVYQEIEKERELRRNERC